MMDCAVLFVILTAIAEFVACRPDAVIVGKTGVGKSTLINNLIGSEVAVVGAGHIGTVQVEAYPYSRRVHLWDTPGFFDSRISAIKILKDIETQVRTVSRIFLAVRTPALGAAGRQGRFPDMDVIQLLFAAVGEDVWRKFVVLVLTFAQWESDLSGVKQLVTSEFAQKGIPVPTVIFAGDDAEGLIPEYWLSKMRNQLPSMSAVWDVNFRFTAIDAALLGTDETSIRDLEQEKARIAAEEERFLRDHETALAAAAAEQERLVAHKRQMEANRQAAIVRAEKERIEAEQKSIELRKAHIESVRRAKLQARIEEARTRLAQEDLNDLRRKHAGEKPECWCDIDLMRRLRRMDYDEELAYVASLPKESATRLFLNHCPEMRAWRMNMWRIPDDLRQYIL